ncbi:hypothetical protein [Microvirga sp. VF16]|uniref:hypothetical protein n=1 Tax=Microvirga sp. VF16 TaxID=2807101 RepID=UPI00193DEFD6|nr:hypothetical protein [Microvirga sp. VF16]QRM32493.1 hypothetical protein JO965_30860 [Microvirga sp. VF16]
MSIGILLLSASALLVTAALPTGAYTRGWDTRLRISFDRLRGILRQLVTGCL